MVLGRLLEEKTQDEGPDQTPPNTGLVREIDGQGKPTLEAHSHIGIQAMDKFGPHHQARHIDHQGKSGNRMFKEANTLL